MLKQRGSLLANKTFYYMPVFSTRHQVESQIEYELDKNDVLVAIDEIFVSGSVTYRNAR